MPVDRGKSEGKEQAKAQTWLHFPKTAVGVANADHPVLGSFGIFSNQLNTSVAFRN